jgi:hypothetical protein
MIKEAINDFRQANGKGRIFTWNEQENELCVLHSLYMAQTGRKVHTPFCFLLHRHEIIGGSYFMFTIRDTIRHIIFNEFSQDPEHRDLLLNYDKLSCGAICDKGQVFLTIRSY